MCVSVDVVVIIDLCVCVCDYKSADKETKRAAPRILFAMDCYDCNCLDDNYTSAGIRAARARSCEMIFHHRWRSDRHEGLPREAKKCVRSTKNAQRTERTVSARRNPRRPWFPHFARNACTYRARKLSVCTRVFQNTFSALAIFVRVSVCRTASTIVSSRDGLIRLSRRVSAKGYRDEAAPAEHVIPTSACASDFRANRRRQRAGNATAALYYAL